MKSEKRSTLTRLTSVAYFSITFIATFALTLITGSCILAYCIYAALASTLTSFGWSFTLNIFKVIFLQTPAVFLEKLKKHCYADLNILYVLLGTVVISKNFKNGGSRHNHALSLGVVQLQPRPCFQRWKHDNLV